MKEEETGPRVQFRVTEGTWTKIELVREYTGRTRSDLVKSWTEEGLDEYFKKPLFRQWLSDQKKKRQSP